MYYEIPKSNVHSERNDAFQDQMQNDSSSQTNDQECG